MTATANQLTDLFDKQLGRAPTDFEIKKFSTASPQTLATLKDSYGKLNTNSSISDYLTSVGQDSSLNVRTELGKKYGITNIGSAEGNTALLKALKSGQTPSVQPVEGSIVAPEQPKTPEQQQQQDASQFNADGSLKGSVQDAANGPQDQQQPPAGPEVPGVPTIETDPTYTTAKTAVTDTLKNYQDYQGQVAKIDTQIANLRSIILQAQQDKEAQAAASGGVVSRSQIAAEVSATTQGIQKQINELLAQRAPLATSQGQYATALQQARKDLSDAQANFYKNISANQANTKIKNQADQFKTKTDIQQDQFGKKEADVQKKLELAGYKKISDYNDGTKVGEHYINLLGQNVKVDPDGNETLIGTGNAVGSGGGPIASVTPKGKVTYTDFSQVADAPTADNRNTVYPGTKQTYGALFEDAVTYAETGKIQSAGSSSKPSTKAYVAAVKAKASNIAASLGLTEDGLRVAYKANSAAIGKLVTQKATISGAENRAKSQIDIILNGYTDPLTGKKVPSLNDSVPRNSWNFVNSLFTSGKIQTGDAPATLLANSLLTFSTEFAKIMGGSTGSSAGSTDAARKEAESLISTGLSNGTLAAQLGLLQKEMDTTTAGIDKAIKDASAGLIGGGKSEQPAVPDVSVDSVITYEGKKYKVDADGNLTPQ